MKQIVDCGLAPIPAIKPQSDIAAILPQQIIGARTPDGAKDPFCPSYPHVFLLFNRVDALLDLLLLLCDIPDDLSEWIGQLSML